MTVPLAWRGILAGAVLAFARAMGEFGATLMVGVTSPAGPRTLSVAIYDAVQAGQYSLANNLVLLISMVSVGVLALLARIGNGRGR